ncbi:MAG: phage tail tape measure protein [Bacteroidales bacterium]|nr:phage tail tape measure protein [Bacteroidales bacterium]
MSRLRDEELRLNVLVNSEEAQKNVTKHREAVTKLKEEIARYEAAVQKGTITQKRAEQEIERCNGKIQYHNSKIEELTKHYELNTMSLKELRKNLKLAKTQLAAAMPGTENFRRLKKEVEACTARIQKLNGATSKMSKLFKGGLIMTGISMAARGISSFAKKIGDFEQANVNLASVLGKDVSQIDMLTRSAQDLGATTRYTASEVTSLQTELAKLGFNEYQIKAMSKGVLNFATAVGTDLASAASLAGATLRIFGLDAAKTDEALGVLAVATNKSALNFSFIQTAMSTVGPVAKTFGFSLRDTTTLLGALANAGFDASSAATATRNILLNLANTNGKLAKSIGAPVKDFDSLMDAFEKLKGSGIDLAGALALTDKRSVSAFNAFLDGVSSARKLHTELGNVEGDLERIATQRSNTLAGSIDKLKSAWEAFILSLNNSKGFLKWVIDMTTKLVTAMRDLTMSKSDKIEFSIDAKMDELQAGNVTDEGIKAELAKMNLHRQQIQTRIKALSLDIKDQEERVKLHEEKDKIDEDIYILQNAWDRVKEIRKSIPTVNPNPTSGSTAGDDNGGYGGKGGSKQQWSLQSDENYLRAKAELTRRYNEDELMSKSQFEEELYQAELTAYTARLASGKDSGVARLKIESDLQTLIMKHREDAAKKEKELEEASKALRDEMDSYHMSAAEKKIQAENTRYAKEREKYKDHLDLLVLIENNHKHRLALINVEAENEALNKSKEAYELRRKNVESYYNDLILQEDGGSQKILAHKKKKNEDLAKIDTEYLNTLKTRLEEIIEAGTLNGIKLTEEQLAKFKTQLADTELKILAVGQSLKENTVKEGAGGGSFLGVSQAEWDSFFTNIKNGKFLASDLVTLMSGIGGAASEGMKIASKAIDLVNAKERQAFEKYKKDNEDKKKSFEDQLNAGILSQEQYNAELERLDKEQQEKEEELSLKQALRAKGMNIAEAIINTAVGVTKTLAQFGPTPWGIAAASTMAALGAAEISLIAATPVSGAEDGGPILVTREQDGKKFNARLSPDKRGFVNRPTVLVGESGEEYVIPASGVDNPTLAPMLATIETARRAGTLRSLDFRAVIPQVFSGREAGGPVSATGSSLNLAGAPAQDKEIINMLNLIVRKMDNIRAYVPLLGEGGIKEAESAYDRARSRGVMR